MTFCTELHNNRHRNELINDVLFLSTFERVKWARQVISMSGKKKALKKLVRKPIKKKKFLTICLRSVN
jgi:hypothetical protein